MPGVQCRRLRSTNRRRPASAWQHQSTWPIRWPKALQQWFSLFSPICVVLASCLTIAFDDFVLLGEIAGEGSSAVPDLDEHQVRLTFEQVKSVVVMIVAHAAKNILFWHIGKRAQNLDRSG